MALVCELDVASVSYYYSAFGKHYYDVRLKTVDGVELSIPKLNFVATGKVRIYKDWFGHKLELA